MTARYRAYFTEWTDENVVVDSGPRAGTILTLSHWPSSPTPTRYRADTSAESVFLYLQQRETRIPEYVTASHYDVDALISLFAWLYPDTAERSRDFWINVAYAGDFECGLEPDARKLARALNNFGELTFSPWSSHLSPLGKAEQHAFLFDEILPALSTWPELLKKHRELWQPGEEAYRATKKFLSVCKLLHVADTDMTIISTDHAAYNIDFSEDAYLGMDPYAVNEIAAGSLVVLIIENTARVVQRYESWVRYISRPIRNRRDLSPLIEWLGQQDDVEWIYDGVQAVAPCLMPVGGRTSIPAARLIEQIHAYNRIAPPAWCPDADD